MPDDALPRHLPIFGEPTALYDVESFTQVPVRRRDTRGATGSFVELKRLLIRTVAR